MGVVPHRCGVSGRYVVEDAMKCDRCRDDATDRDGMILCDVCEIFYDSLKPCPHCERRRLAHIRPPGTADWAVLCMDCHAQGPPQCNAIMAWDAWDKRGRKEWDGEQ